MAALVIAAAGSALGGAVLGTGVVGLGLTGNAIGYLAGSLLASAFAPTQKSQGPRLSDLQVATSAYGTPIPWVAGTPRVAGQVVWASPKRELATTTSQGKGGGGSEYTSYSYEVDLLILLTDVPIVGIRRIWNNGGLIWSAASGSADDSLVASALTGTWRRMTCYPGGPSQLPDPTYEAAVGTNNAPAYRGRGSVFLEGLQLGSSGQLPNLTFEVVAQGAITYRTVGDGLLCHFDSLSAGTIPSALGPDMATSDTMSTTDRVFGTASFNGGVAVADGMAMVIDYTRNWRAEGWFKRPATNSGSFFTISGSLGAYPAITIGWNVQFSDAAYSANFNLGGGSGGGRYGSFALAPVADVWTHVAFQYNRLTQAHEVYINGQNCGTLVTGTSAIGSFNTVSVFNKVDEFYLRFIEDEELFTTVGSVPVAPFTAANVDVQEISVTATPLSTVVSDLCLRCGLTAGQFDVSALSSITVPVRALAVAQVSSGRAVLDMLGSVYFFSACLSDKIYFRPRGGASVATIPYADMGWVAGGDTPPESLALRMLNELEIPAQTALTYSNADGDYQTDTQYSDRLLTGQDSTSATQVPLAFTAAEAKKIVDAMVMDGAVRALTTRITVGQAYAAVECADVLVATAEDGSTFRLFVDKRSDADGIITLDCLLDDASVLTQAGVTVGGTASQTVVASQIDSRLELLDIPLLRDADNLPGHYVAVKGDATGWVRAGLYESLDDTTYELNTTVLDQAVFGIATTTLATFTGGNVFDEVSTLTVAVGLGQLASATRDEVLGSTAVNAALVGNELIQYRSATLVSAGVYALSGLLRGRQGTEWALGSHVAGERFVLLATSGLRFMALQSADLGRLRYYKAVSAGQKLSAVVSKTITPMGVALKPLSPVDARANRDSTNTVLTWRRRTRLSSRITGPLAWSAPLGEAAESYEVEVWDSTYTTLKRTLTASTQTATYTSANQVTDFGSNQTVLYLRIYQLSATVGRGYVNQAIV